MSALQQLLSRKTDKELIFYLNHPNKHTNEAIGLALAELQLRNVDLPKKLIEKTVEHLTASGDKKKYRLNIWKKAGLAFIFSGIAMLFIGTHFFSYVGPPLSQFWKTVGEYSFLCWLPLLIIGILLLFIKTDNAIKS